MLIIFEFPFEYDVLLMFTCLCVDVVVGVSCDICFWIAFVLLLVCCYCAFVFSFGLLLF